MHRKVVAAIVAALAFAVASCGGSERTTLGRAQLVRQVELACRNGQRTTEEAVRKSRQTSGFNFDAMIAGQRVILDKVEELDASGAAKEDFDAFKDGVQQRLDAIEEVAAADRADQVRAMRSVQDEATEAGRRIEQAVQRLGLTGCG